MTRQIPFFGRTPELRFLFERVQHPGVTFICGMPQPGKTRLLEELRDRLSDPTFSHPTGITFLVGYDEAVFESTSTLRRSLQSLYARWLGQSTYREQARRVFQQNRGELINKLGEIAA